MDRMTKQEDKEKIPEIDHNIFRILHRVNVTFNDPERKDSQVNKWD